jgi:hypothetical protein
MPATVKVCKERRPNLRQCPDERRGCADSGRSRCHEPAPSFVPKPMVQSSTAALSENPSLPRSGECSSELAHQGTTYYFWDWTSVEGHEAIRAASGVWRMAKNDIVLLDSLIAKARLRFDPTLDDSEVFELFSFEQVLKSYEPAVDDLESGWTDGGNGGGIDGFFIYVDQRPATPDSPEYALRRNPSLNVHVISSRRSTGFEQQPIDSLISSLGELFDLRMNNSDLSYPYNGAVLQQRSLFKNIFIALADRQPKLTIDIWYCSRGDVMELASNIKARSNVLEKTLRTLFSSSDISVSFLGAAELVTLSRKSFDFNIRLPFTDPPISREGKSFIALCKIGDYFNAISDETGALKRHLFESNVRDFLGDVQVNTDILRTLQRHQQIDESDFWWLNNGVTILATDVRIIAKDLIVENAQIVNGLQTTEVLHNYFAKEKIPTSDDRAVLIKIIAAASNEVRSRIVKATNYQNTIDLSHLRGLDTIQRDIEEFLLDRGWFYDRRKSFYQNQGKPMDRIISIPYLASAVRAIALGDPASSPRQRSRSLRDDKIYNAVFDQRWDLRVYQVCLEIVRSVEHAMNMRRSVWDSPPMALSHFIGFIYTCRRLGKFPYEPNDIVALVGQTPSAEIVDEIRNDLVDASRGFRAHASRFRGVLLSKAFIDDFVRTRLTRAN